MNLAEIMSVNENVQLVVTASDLKEYSENLIREYSALAEKQKPKEIYLKANEACRKLGISRATLWRWKTIDYLKPVEIGGGIRYKQSEIDKLINQGGER